MGNEKRRSKDEDSLFEFMKLLFLKSSSAQTPTDPVFWNTRPTGCNPLQTFVSTLPYYLYDKWYKKYLKF